MGGWLVIILKIWYHIWAIMKKIALKMIYGRKLLIGKNVTWRRDFSVMKSKSAIIEIGNNCFFNNNCSIAANSHIKIGNGCLFGEDVKIYDHNHRFNQSIPLKEQGYSCGEIRIADNCWICSNVIILKGADISEGCVIGAGCVISDFIPPHSIVKQKQCYEINSIHMKENA